jgi:hypothetical protein
MRTITASTLSLLLIAILSGCAPSWKVTGKRFRNAGYRITPPARWMIIHKGSATVLSRHGPALESIFIRCTRAGETYPNTMREVSPEMRPHTLAELFHYNLKATQDVQDVHLRNTSIAKVDSREAVKVEIGYSMNGVQFIDVVYAFFGKSGLYELRYSAAKIHYFKESLDDFELLVQHFSIR